MDMHDPAHPSELLQGWIDDLNMSVTAFAEHIGIAHPLLSRILNGHTAISADMDIRLSEALGTSPGHWLKLLDELLFVFAVGTGADKPDGHD